MTSMVGKSHSSDARMRLQTLQPKFHLRIAAVFILAIVFLSFLSFTKHGVYRAYYGGLSGLVAGALIVQYCRERARDLLLNGMR
jgi:bacteriorhodopsin